MSETDEPDGNLYDSGGMPLTDHNGERMLISYLMHNHAATTNTIELLRPQDIHDPFLRRLYETIIRTYESDEQLTIETMVAALGGTNSAGVQIATLMANADMLIDATELAEHLQIISERRAIGLADDVDYQRPFVSRFGAYRWEDIATDPREGLGYAWFVEDVFPLGEISLAFGDTGSGKSFCLFDLSMASARNIMWNGHHVEHGLVVYVAAEAGKGFKKRKKAYAIHHNLEPTEPLPFVLLTKRPDFFRDDVDAVALIEEIKAIARMYKLPLVCIVIDTLSAISPGMAESASEHVSKVRQRLVMVQDQFEAAIILVHHKPKGGNTPRGHSSLSDDFETTVEFETLADRQTDNGKRIHRGTTRKQREGKNGETWEFTLAVVEVGRNKWNNPETSCIVVPYGTANRPPPGFRLTSTERQFMQALLDAIVDHGQPAPAGLPQSITKVVNCSHVREIMRSRTIKPDADPKTAASSFRVAYMRAGNKLRDCGVLGVQGEFFWWTGKPVIGLSSGPTLDGV